MLDAIAPWASFIPSPAIESARAELLAAIDVAQASADNLAAIATEKRQESEAVKQSALADAATGGKTATERVDFEYEEVRRTAIFAEHHAAASKASRRLRAVVSSETPKHLTAIVGEAEKARERALTAVEKAAKDIRGAIAATEAIRSADKALGLSPVGWHRTTPSKLALSGKATAGLDDVVAFLKTDDPVVTGAYVVDDSPVLSMTTRLALLESGKSVDEWSLFQTELSEGFKVTDFTKHLQLVHQPAEDFSTVYLAVRELPRG